MRFDLARTTSALLGAAICIAAADVARAADLDLDASVDRPVVGLGEIVEYTLTVTSRTGSLKIGNAVPGKLDGFELLESYNRPVIRAGSVQFLIVHRLRATKLGTFTLGPGKVGTATGTISAKTVKVQVVPPGKAPPPPKKKPKSPFDDPFGDPFFKDLPFDPPSFVPPPEAEPDVAPDDPQAKVDAPSTDPNDRNTFVRLVVDDTHPVVGAQVTAKLFVYTRIDPHRAVIYTKKPALGADLRMQPVGATDKNWHRITIDGRLWSYKLADVVALFPLKTGTVTVDPAEVDALIEDAFGQQGLEGEHLSNGITLDVVEPPAEGRPPGYVLGDVVSGLAVTAEVVPRTVEDGHALVDLRMKGVGRLDPLRPILATPPGVTWTTTNDDVRTAVRALTVQGQRRTTFDVRFDKPGDYDLGDAQIEVWDPSKKAYVTARAALGKVHVNVPADLGPKNASALSPLPPPRDGIGKKGDGSTLVDHAFTWGLVAGAPLAVLMAQGTLALARKRKARASEREASAAEQSRVALDAAREAEKRRDRAETIASLVRALDRAVEEASGVRPRGLTRAELSRTLKTSVLASLASDIVDMFDALESARFAGGAPPRVDDVAALVARVRESGRSS